MEHGTPLATGTADNQFLLEVGISSSYHIARFFGLASTAGSAERSQKQIPITVAHAIDETDRAKTSAEPLDGEVLEPNVWPASKQPAVDIGAVITKALRTAGLLKTGGTRGPHRRRRPR